MTQRIFLLALLTILCTRGRAQTYFERYLDTGPEAEDLHFTTTQLNDGRFAVASFRRTPGGGSSQAVLYVLRPNGEIENVAFGPTTRRNSLRELIERPDGNLLLYSAVSPSPQSNREDWVLTLLNQDFTIIGGRSFGTMFGDEQIRQVIPLPGGGYAVVGEMGDVSRGLITRLDEDLNPVWRRQFTQSGTQLIVVSAVAATATGLVVAGNERLAQGGRAFLAHYDQFGELDWSYRYVDPEARSTQGARVFAVADDYLMVDERTVGDQNDISLLRVNAAGDVVSYGFLEGERNTFLGDAWQLPGGGLVVAGRTEDTNGMRRGLLLEISPDGSVAWARELERGDELLFNSIRPRTDGIPGFVVGGYIRTCGRTDRDIVVLTVDETGSVRSDCAATDLALNFVAATTNRGSFGQSAPFSDGEGLTLSLSLGFATQSGHSCPRLEPDPDQSSGAVSPLEYLAPEVCVLDGINVVDVDVSANSEAIDSVVIVITNPLGSDVLEYTGPFANRVSGAGTQRITIDYFGLVDALPDFLRNVVVNDASQTAGERIVSLTAHRGCNQSPLGLAYLTATGGAPPAITLPDTLAFCPGESVDLFTGLAPSFAITWNTGDTGDGLEVTQPGRYSFTAINDCSEAVDSAVVIVSGGDLLPAADQTFALCLGDTARLDATTPNATGYRWSDGVEAPVRLFTDPGTYELTASSPCDTVVTRVSVTVTNCCQLYLPNAFSPNGDGINDVFRPGRGNCGALSDYSLSVYDRWGGLLFNTTDPVTGWDGGRDGKSLSPGTYVFTLEYFNGLETVRQANNVILLR